MRIDAKSEIAGVAAAKVRDYLRGVKGSYFGADNVACAEVLLCIQSPFYGRFGHLSVGCTAQLI